VGVSRSGLRSRNRNPARFAQTESGKSCLVATNHDIVGWMRRRGLLVLEAARTRSASLARTSIDQHATQAEAYYRT